MTQTYTESLIERMKFMPSAPVAFNVDDAVSDLLDGNMFKVVDAVIDYSLQDEFASTFKAMLSAYHNSLNALKPADRELSHENFLIFAKSFSIVCINSLELSVKA